jgi:GT2 family glycosyltransferase
MSGLRVPAIRRPDVSIVVVTYNSGDVVSHAVRTLLERTEACYELILVDNGSDDSTPALIQQVENATVVLNPRNYGFSVANNQGAARARGRHVFFLNPDVFVNPGWLPPLLRLIDADGRTGAVGPMVLSPDGSLQFAGALLSRSGSTACYGDGDRPDRSEYRVSRVVDYLGGGCLLVRRRAFNEVGGFDPAYGLLYSEDVDLCLALAARDYRSIYEPSSSVIHERGMPSAALSLQAQRNRALLEQRWRRVLAARPLAPLETSRRRMLAAREAPAVAAADREVVDPLLQAWLGSASDTEQLMSTASRGK